MFNDLLIRNFEIHRKTYFKFIPGLNIVVGSTDSGKSTIIRAFEWIIKNRPTGNSFIRNPKKKVSAESTFNNVPIHRYKSKKVNAYKIGKKELTHIGVEVPDAVSDLLNLGEENIQTQDEFFFLLSDTPGQVAKKLNSIGGLEIMDSMLQAVNSDIRSLNASRKSIFKTMDYTKELVKDLLWTEQAQKEFLTIERMEKTNKKKKKKIDTVKNVSAKILLIQYKLSTLLDKKIGNEISLLSKMSGDQEKMGKYIKTVKELLMEIKETKKTLCGIVVPDIESMHRLHENRANLKEKIEKAHNLIRKHHELKERVFILDSEIIKAEKKYKDKLIEIGECPTCGASTL